MGVEPVQSQSHIRHICDTERCALDGTTGKMHSLILASAGFGKGQGREEAGGGYVMAGRAFLGLRVGNGDGAWTGHYARSNPLAHGVATELRTESANPLPQNSSSSFLLPSFSLTTFPFKPNNEKVCHGQEVQIFFLMMALFNRIMNKWEQICLSKIK